MRTVNFEEKKENKRLILNYVRTSINKGHYPNYTQIQKDLHLDIRLYFKGMKDIYNNLGMSYVKISKLKSIHKSKLIRDKKLRFPVEKGRKKIIDYIKEESAKGHFPGLDEINEHFGIWIGTYFKNIRDAYKRAKINFRKKNLNPFIGQEKEEKLILISIALLNKMGYEILGISRNSGADLIVKDKNGGMVPVELKAYHKNSNIPISNVFGVYENEIEQLKRYIEINNSSYGILITTTDRIRLKIPSNVILINGKELVRTLVKNNLSKYLPLVKWIRNTYQSYDKTIHLNNIRKKVADFILGKLSGGNYPTMREIQNQLNINIGTYFSGMQEVYRFARVKPPLEYLPKNYVRNRVINYIKQRIKNGKRPSLEEVEKNLKICLRTYFKSPKEIYNLAKITIPCKYLSIEDARKFIISYVRDATSKGKNVSQRQIDKDLGIDVYSYFKDMRELKKFS